MNYKSFSLIDHFPSRVAVQKAKCSKAFTLIELLVVVMIILVLAAMLIPALGRAKYVARKSACASNMRQIALAYSTYANDNDMHYPMNGSLRTTNSGFISLDGGAFGAGYKTKKLIAPYLGVSASAIATGHYGSMAEVFTCPVTASFASPYRSYNVFAAAINGQDAGTIGDNTGPSPIVYLPDGGGIATDGYAGKAVVGESTAIVNRVFKPVGGIMLKVGQPIYSKNTHHYYDILVSDWMTNSGKVNKTANHSELQPDFQPSSDYYVSTSGTWPTSAGNFAREDGSVKEYVCPDGKEWYSGWNMYVGRTPGFESVGGQLVPVDFRVDAPQ